MIHIFQILGHSGIKQKLGSKMQFFKTCMQSDLKKASATFLLFLLLLATASTQSNITSEWCIKVKLLELLACEGQNLDKTYYNALDHPNTERFPCIRFEGLLHFLSSVHGCNHGSSSRVTVSIVSHPSRHIG